MLKADTSTNMSGSIIDVQDHIKAAIDYIHITSLAADGIGGEIGSAVGRAMIGASDALLSARIILANVVGGCHEV